MTGTQVEVVAGDIADFATHQAEAYVVAANNELWMGSGVAGALKRVAGEAVEQEAVVTGAGQMPAPARILIHAAAMGFTDRTQIYASVETVSSATRRCLDLCNEHGITSVVFPALGTGVGALEIEECARAMCAAITDHFADGSQVQRISVVVTNEERAGIFRQFTEALAPEQTDTT